MDDLNDKINRLLSSPDSMEKIQSALAALGGGATPNGGDSTPDASATEEKGAPLEALPDLAILSKMAPLMSAFNKEDPDTRLLAALRPYLHGEREQRLDETMKLLRLMRLVPLLQTQGILGIPGLGGKSGKSGNPEESRKEGNRG